MSISRGTIILVPFPFTDLSNFKIRPALVVSSSDLKEDIIVAFITSVIPGTLNKTDFKIIKSESHFEGSGLKKDSVVKCDKISTLSKSIVLGGIGELSIETMNTEINCRLKTALSL